MVDEETKNDETEEESEHDDPVEDEEPRDRKRTDSQGVSSAPVTAKNLPAPSTRLAVPPRGELGAMTVSLGREEEAPLTLEEVQAINNDSQSISRTPLMTLIQALLADNGGPMRVDELTQKVVENWNRPFPTSPYTNEELIYVIAYTSDELRIQ